MRLLVVTAVLAAALAGCTAPVEEPADPLFGVCPQWIGGDWEWAREITLTGNDTTVFLPMGDDGALLEHQGWPLDRYTVRFHDVDVDGLVEVRAFADEADRRIAFTDGDGATSILFAELESGSDLELDVFLSAVAHGSEPAPDGLRLHWTGGSGTVTATVTAAYKVCGVPL